MKNVLFISIDDLINVVRYRHSYGTPFQTPNIDRLLDMGVYFNGAHALVAECNPSRASVLTGQSLFRTGVEDNAQRFFDLVDPTTTLPYLFRVSGYETAAVGKVFHRWVEPGDRRGGLIGFMNELFDVHRLTRGDTDRGGRRRWNPGRYRADPTSRVAAGGPQSRHLGIRLHWLAVRQ